MSTVTLTSSSPADLRVDAVVVGVTQGRSGPVLADGAAAVDAAFGGKLARTVAALGGTGKTGEVTKVPGAGATKAPLVLAVGLGAADKVRDAEALRRAAGTAVRFLAGTPRVAVALPTPDVDAVAAVAEGALFGAYAFLRYRTTSRADHKDPVETITLTSELGRDRSAKAAVTRAHVLADAVRLTRDLVNTAPSDLHPKELAQAATEAAEGLDLEVTVLDERALRRRGYGGILGVGQGSVHPPRLVRLDYRHPQATTHVALVGKGITFDSGGLSLKPSQSMEWMKSDMGGAAAVIAAMTAIARLGLAVNVTGWAPMAENMPSGTASRPSDIFTIYGGKTVEVLNTDAEGRLILADALVTAGELNPDVVVDIATLTGAQLVALGSRTAAVMANDDALRDQVITAAQRAGEAVWPMPLPEELRKSLDSEVADISNMGERYGGMLVAGLFLKEFVPEGARWAHLDIAGPSFNSGEAYGYTPRGGTGMGVRTLVRLVEDLAGPDPVA
ncbi:MAG: leucyl aminopeptidase [Actinomycetota bacterium]|nr:leucyl aminopeptidase [Actinomycetota bacterium]